MFPLKIYEVLVVRPLRPRERRHSASHNKVVAGSEDEALAALRERRYPEAGHVFKTVGVQELGEGATLIGQGPLYTMSATDVAQLSGKPLTPKVVAVKEPKLSTRALTETQGHVLTSLSRARFPGSWVWSSASRTQAILEGLRMRMLVDFDGAHYTLNDEGRKALAAAKAG